MSFDKIGPSGILEEVNYRLYDDLFVGRRRANLDPRYVDLSFGDL